MPAHCSAYPGTPPARSGRRASGPGRPAKDAVSISGALSPTERAVMIDLAPAGIPTPTARPPPPAGPRRFTPLTTTVSLGGGSPHSVRLGVWRMIRVHDRQVSGEQNVRERQLMMSKINEYAGNERPPSCAHCGGTGYVYLWQLSPPGRASGSAIATHASCSGRMLAGRSLL